MMNPYFIDPLKLKYKPAMNLARLKWDWLDLEKQFALDENAYEKFWKEIRKTVLPKAFLESPKKLWLEIGAGNGDFFAELAQLHSDKNFLAMERSKDRGNRLTKKASKLKLDNFVGLRANAIPAVMDEMPTEKVERVYILYPSPWPKNKQRRQRWYMHPMMKHMVRILEKGGMMVWCSDQEFYIQEAAYVCEEVFKLKILSHGVLKPNLWNDLERFPKGRTRFEQTFIGCGESSYELVCMKS